MYQPRTADGLSPARLCGPSSGRTWASRRWSYFARVVGRRSGSAREPRLRVAGQRLPAGARVDGGSPVLVGLRRARVGVCVLPALERPGRRRGRRCECARRSGSRRWRSCVSRSAPLLQAPAGQCSSQQAARLRQSAEQSRHYEKRVDRTDWLALGESFSRDDITDPTSDDVVLQKLPDTNNHGVERRHGDSAHFLFWVSSRDLAELSLEVPQQRVCLGDIQRLPPLSGPGRERQPTGAGHEVSLRRRCDQRGGRKSLSRYNADLSPPVDTCRVLRADRTAIAWTSRPARLSTAFDSFRMQSPHLLVHALRVLPAA